MIFSAAGLSLYFNKTTFGVERLSVDGDPERVSFVYGRTFGLPSGNNFLLKSEFEKGRFYGEFLYFSDVVCSVVVTEKPGAVSFSYTFKNQGKESVTLQEGDLGVCTPFFDRFDDPQISLRRRVHAHVRAQGAAYVYCERYSGDLPAFGLVFVKGECYSYALERGAAKGERGQIALRFPAMTLDPQQEYSCEFLLFPCNGREDFFQKADDFGFLTAQADELTVFKGEEVVFKSSRAVKLQTQDGETAFVDGVCRIKPKEYGSHVAFITSDTQTLQVKYYVLPEDLAANRIKFVTDKQQLSEGRFAGAFTAYDRKSDQKIVRSGVRSPFSLGGFRAAPLLFLLREAQKRELSDEIRKKISQAIAFYDREIYRGGEVADDVGGKRTRFFKKYYNYPLYAAIKMEEYNYTGDLEALMQSAVILSNLFKSGSVYEVTPAESIVNALRAAGKTTVAGEITDLISAAADKLIASGNKYTSFKGLPYGPEIVYGALSTLLDAYFLTGKEYYLLVAKEHLARLETFSFPSTDYASHCIPEIFQEDRGNGLVYDMSPHFTAVHFAAVYDKYYRATQCEKYRELSRRIVLSCMTLFDREGASYRSKSAVAMVNDVPLSSYEEISCGEDVVLYHFDLLFGRK